MKIEINNTGAFTLIEMILAIGIAVIVLIAANTAFFTSLHLRDATSDAVDAASPIDQSLVIMRRDLQCAVPPKPDGILSGDFKLGNVTSLGISDSVAAEMYTADAALSANAPWGDIQRVTYELKSPTTGNTTSRDLYRSVTRNLLTESTPDVEDQLMIRGVDSVKFSGYDGSQWSDSWDTTDTTSANTNLPIAVRVDIQLSSDKNGSPIEIFVPIDSQSRSNSDSTVGGS